MKVRHIHICFSVPDVHHVACDVISEMTTDMCVCCAQEPQVKAFYFFILFSFCEEKVIAAFNFFLLLFPNCFVVKSNSLTGSKKPIGQTVCALVLKHAFNFSNILKT